MIRLAKKIEIPRILSITKACAKDMIIHNILQWNEDYPSKNAFENDIKRNELYVLISDNTIIGCMVLTPNMDTEYIPINWLTGNDNNLYIHRLAIHPKNQGKGFAQILMDFAEQYAIHNNYISIRLDTFSKNVRNQKFYEIRGFKRLGEIHFPKQSEFPFYCYEWLCKK
jgi:ribosomal protein S18 acetylase RimI-like enzyme|tara:strand:- start:38 stop:544 length:507 start_codon:yes stop_codon:yes gene_type:complete